MSRSICEGPSSLLPETDRSVATASMIPPELLGMILRRLRDQSQMDLVVALRVSQLWAMVGRPVVWKDVVIRSLRQLAVFVRATKLSPDTALHTQSLTIGNTRGVGECGFLGDPDTASLRDLTEMLASLRNLRIFSLSSSNMSFYLPRPDDLDAILKSLPESLTSLEISLHQIRVLPASKPHALLKLLPRLHHLRIDGPFACRHLFSRLEIECPELRSVVINDSRRRCETSCEPCDPYEWRGDLIGEQIALAGRRAHEAGYLPRLTSFIVITRSERNQQGHGLQYPSQTNGAPPHANLTFSSLQRKDVLENQTSSYPLAQLDEGKQYWMLRYPRPTDNDDGETETAEGFGKYRDLTILVEGTDTWEQTTKGARFPPAFRETAPGRSADYTWSDIRLRLLAPDELVPAIKVVTRARLWNWERVCARKLLHPRRHKGLGRGPVLEREVCEEERNWDGLVDWHRATCDW